MKMVLILQKWNHTKNTALQLAFFIHLVLRQQPSMSLHIGNESFRVS